MYQAGKHRDSRGLASAIMAKQAEDLICVHLHVEPIDSLKAILILLMQVIDLEEVLSLFFSVDLGVQLFVAERVQECCLKSFSLFNRVKCRDSISSGKDVVLSGRVGISAFSIVGLVNAANLGLGALLLAASVVAGHAEETGMSPTAESLGHNLLKVETYEQEPEAVD